MNLNAFLLEQVLRQLRIPRGARRFIQLASEAGTVEGQGFPSELAELSGPMVARGLLNYAYIQNKRGWVFPYWAERQLNPADVSFVPRSQNPLWMNITHRNWTALGTPTGEHEAIIDPHGLVTPLPRQWSVDTWVWTEGFRFFPSRAPAPNQQLLLPFPNLHTEWRFPAFRFSSECFVAGTRRGDVLFHSTELMNLQARPMSAYLCTAVRPFNPEGVAPIEALEFRPGRFLNVDGVVGVVLAEPPDIVCCSDSHRGDLSALFDAVDEQEFARALVARSSFRARCRMGLAHALLVYRAELPPGASRTLRWSVALMTDGQLRRQPVKSTWRVSYEKRRADHQQVWRNELAGGAHFDVGDDHLQSLLDASRLAVLQLDDNGTITPGPFLYHRFWIRDAVMMVRALQVLGYLDRSRRVIDAWAGYQNPGGYFQAPQGEWDSNGHVLWGVWQHYQLTRSVSWLKQWYPRLLKAGRWISAKRRHDEQSPGCHPGLMPRGLSAEHLGIVDQYYWDSFWSYGGLQALREIAFLVGEEEELSFIEPEIAGFRKDLRSSLESASQRLGRELIPASPSRPFDEGAIGNIPLVYPLDIRQEWEPYATNTVEELIRRFVDDRGFFHPIIHSGYNVYLTLQLAQACLTMGDSRKAWRVAETVLAGARPPYAFPEAIHPRTGGGSMGDGHHGWAAAECVLFLRNALMREEGRHLALLRGYGEKLRAQARGVSVRHAPTTFGAISFSFRRGEDQRLDFELSTPFSHESAPESITVHVPFTVREAVDIESGRVMPVQRDQNGTVLTLRPAVAPIRVKMTPTDYAERGEGSQVTGR